MLVSVKIKKAITAEIKEQENFLKKLETQEINYKVDFSNQKEEIKKIIANYNKIIKEI